MFEVKVWGGLVIYLEYAICAYNFSLLVALLSAWNTVLKTVLCLQWNLIWLYECVPSLDTILCSCQFDLRKKRRENMWLINQIFICPPMLEPLLATTVVWLNLQSQNPETNKLILFCLWKENIWVLKTDLFNAKIKCDLKYFEKAWGLRKSLLWEQMAVLSFSTFL